jgi:phosphatidylserine synthase
MGQSNPINWFKIAVRLLAFAIIAPFPIAAIILFLSLNQESLLWQNFWWIIFAPYFLYTGLTLFGRISVAKLKRLAFAVGLFLWMIIGFPIFLLLERDYPLMLTFMMFLILPLVVICFYLLLSRILLYFAEKQGGKTINLTDAALRLE